MRAAVELRDGDLALLLYLLHRGIPIETTGLDPLLLQDLPHLADCEILGYVGGKPQVRLRFCRRTNTGRWRKSGCAIRSAGPISLLRCSPTRCPG